MKDKHLVLHYELNALNKIRKIEGIHISKFPACFVEKIEKLINENENK